MAELDAMSEATVSMPRPWRGALAFALLGVVGALGPDITASPHYPDLMHYLPRYVLLALSIGIGMTAIRSRQNVDRVFGLAVVVAGIAMVAYIVANCLQVLQRV